MSAAAAPLPRVIVPKVAPMPTEREAVTGKFRIHAAFGSHKLYVTVGLREDGTVGEVFARIDKEGSTMRAMLDAWCIMVSIAMQHGVSLEEISEKFLGRRFEPSGRAEPAQFGEAKSVLDLIVRYMIEVEQKARSSS